MRHYEVVLLIHPDQSDKAVDTVERYIKLVNDNQGVVHRFEDWGRRQLEYPINKVHKAHYVLLNIECDGKTLSELEELFKYNDAIIRSLVIRRDEAITEKSVLAKSAEEKRSRKSNRRSDEQTDNAQSDTPVQEGE